MIGDKLLAQGSHPDWTDPNTGMQHPAEPAGATLLMRELDREFGVGIQELNIQALDAFFLLQRANLSLGDFLTLSDPHLLHRSCSTHVLFLNV